MIRLGKKKQSMFLNTEWNKGNVLSNSNYFYVLQLFCHSSSFLPRIQNMVSNFLHTFSMFHLSILKNECLCTEIQEKIANFGSKVLT